MNEIENHNGNKYKVILADPPWSFKTFSSKGKGKSADNHYRTMSLEDICALPVQSMAEKDAVLFIWTTFPMLENTFKVINAWGFKYKTCAFTWMKKTKRGNGLFMGMGYWTRSNAEICLLATRRKPKRKSKSVCQAILSNVREHSRKPEEVYSRIEALIDGPYVELFARTRREGWASFGDETEKFPTS